MSTYRCHSSVNWSETKTSPSLFLLAADLVLKISTPQKRNGIKWALKTKLDDCDFTE